MVWPLIISFSLRYESDFLFSMLNLTQFVNFCLRLLLLFGLIFELPLILLILARVGIVRVDFPAAAAAGGDPAQCRGGRLSRRRAHHGGHRHPHLR